MVELREGGWRGFKAIYPQRSIQDIDLIKLDFHSYDRCSAFERHSVRQELKHLKPCQTHSIRVHSTPKNTDFNLFRSFIRQQQTTGATDV